MNTRGEGNIRVCPWHMGHQQLLSDARAAQFVHYLVRQRKYFESIGTGGVETAYRWGHAQIAKEIEVSRNSSTEWDMGDVREHDLELVSHRKTLGVPDLKL
jgi:hypothetical protein